MKVTTIGFDIAKRVIQIHGVDAAGVVTVRKRMSREGAPSFFARLEPCLVGMEACGGAHYWGRELASFGHTVRLISPLYVKPYVKRSKTDAADAAAICEAVSRPHMRFVPVKSRDDQALAQAYKTRGLLVAQRTALVNALRAHLTEFGIVAPIGPAGAARLIALVRANEEPLPELARQTLVELVGMIEATHARITIFDARLKQLAAADEASRYLTDGDHNTGGFVWWLSFETLEAALWAIAGALIGTSATYLLAMKRRNAAQSDARRHYFCAGSGRL